MIYYDAHNHLQDARLAPAVPQLWSDLEGFPIGAAVVNGTQESDWEAVLVLAKAHDWVRPAFGLHPWYINRRSADWEAALLNRLDQDPRAVIGEIGLDRWIEGHDLAAQMEVFRTQMKIAVERNLPATIHCLKAWGALGDYMREHAAPRCGYLLHSYGGPLEMVDSFTRTGAYFSFSAYFLHEHKGSQREVFRQIPEERLLIETDAPDMAPPDDRNRHPLPGSESGKPINHPLNLEVSYAGLAEIRGWTLEQTAEIVAENYERLFDRN